MQTNVVMQTKHVREEVPLLHYTELLSRYTLRNVHNWASCTATTTSPHSRTPTRPRLDFWKSDLIVRLSEIFYARERGQWHRRHSAPCTSQRAPPPKCTPTPSGAPMGDLIVALTRGIHLLFLFALSSRN